VHAIGQQLKWSLLRYSPIDMVHWADLGRLYAFAEQGGLETELVPLYKGAQAPSSPRNEVLQTLMLAVASTDSMRPEQIEIAERSVALFVEQYLIERTAAPACTHVFDLSMSEPPRRIGRTPPADQASLRYFGAGSACDEMTRTLETMLAEGSLPRKLDVGAGHDPQAIAQVWRHLLQYWSSSPPERRSARRATNVPLRVVHGFRGLSSKFMRIAKDSLDFTQGAGPAPETWVADNVSAGGYGVTAPAQSCEWVRVGVLVGLKPQGENRWSAGIVRRLSRADEQHRHLGIEIVAPVVIPVRLTPFGKMAVSDAVREPDFGILMTPRPDAERAIQLMIAADTFSPKRLLQMSIKDQVFQIAPVKLLQSTDEFDLARFTIVRRIQ